MKFRLSQSDGVLAGVLLVTQRTCLFNYSHLFFICVGCSAGMRACWIKAGGLITESSFISWLVCYATSSIQHVVWLRLWVWVEPCGMRRRLRWKCGQGDFLSQASWRNRGKVKHSVSALWKGLLSERRVSQWLIINLALAFLFPHCKSSILHQFLCDFPSKIFKHH